MKKKKKKERVGKLCIHPESKGGYWSFMFTVLFVFLKVDQNNWITY